MMNYHRRTENERCLMYALKKATHREHEIARCLGRSPSTISRELRGNGGLRAYRPGPAQRLTQSRRKGAYKAIKVTDPVWSQVVELIKQELSHQQVIDYLKRHKQVWLHHERVYRGV